MANLPDSSNDTLPEKKAKDSSTMYHFTSTATSTPQPAFSFSKPSASIAHARKIEEAEREVEKAEAKVKLAQVNFCFSVVSLVSCMKSTIDTALEAARMDVERKLNHDLKAKLTARIDWTVKLAEKRVELIGELLGMWEIVGLMKGGEECGCAGKAVKKRRRSGRKK